MNPVILRHVSKTYRLDAVDVPALSDVDLEIRPDRFTVISGASGSGKTTLLNMIGCIDRPDRGEIIVSGQPVQALSDDDLSDFRARHLGFIFQNFNLLPVLTAYENVEYPLLMTGVPPAERKKKVLAMLDAVGLSARAKPPRPALWRPAPARGDRARAGARTEAGAGGRADRQPGQPDERRHHQPDAQDAARAACGLRVFLA
jgi:ABC-type lipoprotein export system ATPase subunit